MIIKFLNLQPSTEQKKYIEKLINNKITNLDINKIVINMKNDDDLSQDNYHVTIKDRSLIIEANNYRSVIYFFFDDKTDLINKHRQTLQIAMKFRGIMIDNARNRILNFNTFKFFIEQCILNHLNIFQIYFEGTIEYQETKDLKIGKISWNECKQIKKYCELHGLIFSVAFPNLGHLYDLLIQKKYCKLSATEIKSFNYSLYDKQMHYSLNPLYDKAIYVSQNLIKQVLDNLNPKYINLCGDETFDLLTQEFEQKTKSVNTTPYKIYQEFLINNINKLIAQDKIIMLWTDIMASHKKEKISNFLVENVIGLTWNYHPQAYADDFKFIDNQKMQQVNCFMADSCNEGIMNLISSFMNMTKLNTYYKVMHESTIGLMMTVWNDCGSNNSLFSVLPLLYEFNDLILTHKNILGSSFSQKFLHEPNLIVMQLIQSLTMSKCVTFKDILFWYEQKFQISIHKIFNQEKFKNIPSQNCQINNTYLNWVKISLQDFFNSKHHKETELFKLYFQDIFLLIDNFILNNSLCNYIQKYELNLEVPTLAMNIAELKTHYQQWKQSYILNWQNNYITKDIGLIPDIYQKIIEYFNEKIK